MSRHDFRFFHSLRVRWVEVDMQGVVFNGHYLTYFDVAFTEYWRATGLPGPAQQAAEGQELFARKAGVEYLGPAHFDDLLDIGVRCAKVGRTSMRFVIELYRGNTQLVAGEMVYVYADTRIRKPVPIPGRWRDMLCDFEGWEGA